MSSEIVCICGKEFSQYMAECPKCEREPHEIVGTLWEQLHKEASNMKQIKNNFAAHEGELHGRLDNLQKAAVELTGRLKEDDNMDDALHLRLDRLLSEIAACQESRLKLKKMIL